MAQLNHQSREGFQAPAFTDREQDGLPQDPATTVTALLMSRQDHELRLAPHWQGPKKPKKLTFHRQIGPAGHATGAGAFFLFQGDMMENRTLPDLVDKCW
ncbi:MAG: hypothetical protein AB1641_06325 [Thermodesulfobacteriota bacterium]